MGHGEAGFLHAIFTTSRESTIISKLNKQANRKLCSCFCSAQKASMSLHRSKHWFYSFSVSKDGWRCIKRTDPRPPGPPNSDAVSRGRGRDLQVMRLQGGGLQIILWETQTASAPELCVYSYSQFYHGSPSVPEEGKASGVRGRGLWGESAF